MVDVVHRPVMLGQLVVQALPGREQLGRRRRELRLSRDRQRWLVEQEADLVQHHPARQDDAVPEPAEILWRDVSPAQRLLHLLDERAKAVLVAVVRDRCLARPEADRLALGEVPQGGFEGRVPRFEEAAPIVRPAEVPDPGQEFPIDGEFEPAVLAVDGVLAAGRVGVVLDRIVQGLADALGNVPQRLVIPVEQHLAALPRDALLVQRLGRSRCPSAHRRDRAADPVAVPTAVRPSGEREFPVRPRSRAR